MMTDNLNRNVINMAARLVDNQAITYKEDLGDLRQIAALDKEHDYVPEIKIIKESARILHDIAEKIRDLKITVDENEDILGTLKLETKLP